MQQFLGIYSAISPFTFTDYEIAHILCKSKRLLDEPESFFLSIEWPETLEQHKKREISLHFGGKSKDTNLTEKLISLVLDPTDNLLANLNIKLYNIWSEFMAATEPFPTALLQSLDEHHESADEKQKNTSSEPGSQKDDSKDDNQKADHLESDEKQVKEVEEKSKSEKMSKLMAEIELERLENLPLLTEEEMPICRRMVFLRLAQELTAKCIQLMLAARHERESKENSPQSLTKRQTSAAERKISPFLREEFLLNEMNEVGIADSDGLNIICSIEKQLAEEAHGINKIVADKLSKRIYHLQTNDNLMVSILNQFASIGFDSVTEKITLYQCHRAEKILSKLIETSK